MFLEDHHGLLKNYTGIVKLFEILRERSMEAIDINEKFALQSHYYSFLFKTAGNQYNKKGITGLINS